MTVSICIATYNGERYIKQQLDSIICQIQKNDEIIISDDGSTDNTISIIQMYDDNRIKLIKNLDTHGCTYNFQNALKNCSGDVIFLVDQDDVWFREKYEVMLMYLEKYDLVHCNSFVTDEELNVVEESFYNILKNGKGIIRNIIKSTYYGSHMAFNRKLLNYAFPFPTTSEIGHDLWIGLVAEMTGKVYFTDTQLMYYRRHDDAHCSINGRSGRPFIIKLKGRFLMVYYLIKFMIRQK